MDAITQVLPEHEPAKIPRSLAKTCLDADIACVAKAAYIQLIADESTAKKYSKMVGLVEKVKRERDEHKGSIRATETQLKNERSRSDYLTQYSERLKIEALELKAQVGETEKRASRRWWIGGFIGLALGLAVGYGTAALMRLGD